MLSHPIVSHSMSLGLPDKVHLPGVAANVLLAAGAVLLKPALDFLLISGFPDSSVTTLGGDIAYSKGLTLVLEPTVKGYQHHDVVVPFLKTTKSILSSMPLQPSAGVMFGMTACFLSLAAAGTFLVRSHTGSEPGGPSSTPLMSSLPETLAYNREQRQSQNGRATTHRRGRRWREFSILLSLRCWLTRFILTCSQPPIPCRPITIRTIYLLTSSRTRLVSRFLRIIYLSL